jgi:predicted amidohydrolase
MDIFLVQMAIARGKPELNRAKVEALTSGILPGKPGKSGLIVLPELFSTGFLDTSAMKASEKETWAAVAPADTLFLSALARRLGAFVMGTTVELGSAGLDGNGGFQNLSLLFSPEGTELSRYQKMHPFSYGGEDRLFTRGNELVTAAIQEEDGSDSWIVQSTICYDLRFPELYRAGSRQGVHLIVVQANWPDARQAHWETLLRARAIENQAYVAGVNCVGEQGALRFIGGSTLISPKGETLAQAGEEEVLVHGVAELNLCKQWRKQFPALRDRRSEDIFGA